MRRNTYSKILLSGLVLISFIACNCETYGDGMVLDYNTKEPISGVVVKSYVEKAVPSYVSQMITDSTGMFYGNTGKTTGGFSGCKDLMLEFQKEGYSDRQVYNPQGEKVYLKPIE